HFGQSNLTGIVYPNILLRVFHYLLWGALVLFTPIILHAEEAQSIVLSMTGTLLPIASTATLKFVIAGLIVANLLLFIILLATKLIPADVFIREITHLVVLLLLFFNTSLLLGFTVYFVFWHSVSSILDQTAFFQRRIAGYRPQDFLRAALPIILIGGIIVSAFMIFIPKELILSPNLMGYVFIGISLLTLPHMILVDNLYRQPS
ncbi:MAG: Brp/Blh family beta-carotene 15,15'-dioxygenase, partial [Bacteroidota bacterium]